MAIKRPDIYEHNNPNYSIADSDSVRGGFRTAVSGLTALYALAPKLDQLKEHSTIVYVSGETKYYILVDIANVGNVSGWNEFQTGGGGEGTITGATNGIILVNSGTTVALGGILTSGTTINASGHSFSLTNINEFQVKTSGDTTVLGVDKEGFLLSTTGGSVTFDDGGGLKYSGDYSSGYTANSIPDVNFVTGQTSYLKLDQSTPQNVTGSQAVFDEGIIFGATPNVSQISGHTAGKMYYDEIYETISVDVGTESILQLGQEFVRYVYNSSGSILPNGSAVRIVGVHSGSGVDTVSVNLAIATGATESQVVGITTQEIGVGAFGFATVFGNINGLNTDTGSQYSGMTVGDRLFLSATEWGGITNTPPTAPNLTVVLGYLITKDPTIGKIFSGIYASLSLNDLNNVSVPAPALDNILKWNGTEWVSAALGSTSAGSGVNFYYATPTINAVTPPAGLSEDGTLGNGIEVATFSRTPVTSGATLIVGGIGTNDTRPFAAWGQDVEIGRTQIDSGLWEFYDYVSIDDASDDTWLIHGMYQVVPITGSTISITGAGANSRTATISSGQFSGTYFNADATNVEASYLQTEDGIYQITASINTNIVTITVPTGYLNETAVSGSTWNPLFTGSTETIESTTTLLYQTKIVAPAFTVAVTDKIGQILYVSTNGAPGDRELSLSYNGTSAASFVISPLVTLHNELAGLQGGTGSYRGHITDTQNTIVNNTSGTNTGDETKSTIESKLTGEIFTHWHPYSGLTGAPDLSQYQSVSGFTGYTATTQPIIDAAITGATSYGIGTDIYSGSTGRDLKFNSITGSGGTTVQKVGDDIIITSTSIGGGQLYSGETPSAVNLCGIYIGYELTGKTVSCIIQDLLVPNLTGTITEPSIGIGLTYSGIQEIGLVISQEVTGTYNQGCIDPQYQSISDKRNPVVNAYSYTGAGMPASFQSCGVSPASETAVGYVVSGGSQSWGVCACYDSGTTALSSKGFPYGAVPVSDCTNAPSGSVTGILPWYYGTNPTCSITNSIITGGTKVVENVIQSTPIIFNADTEYMWFAAPACATEKTKWWVTSSNCSFIGGVGNAWASSCSVVVSSGQACWAGCSYDVYVTCSITSTDTGIPMCLYY